MRKLWNRPDLAVWSLSTNDRAGKGNMNICTYVTAVSMNPKLMMVAVYHSTKTRKNIQLGSTVILQLLSESLAPAVRVCGQQSGNSIDKITRLKKRFRLQEHNGLYYFSDACGFMELRITDVHEVAGDHTLVTGEVIFSKNLYAVPVLTTTYLKENKITR